MRLKHSRYYFMSTRYTRVKSKEKSIKFNMSVFIHLDGPEVSQDVDLEGLDDLVVGCVQDRISGHDPRVVH